MVGEQQEYWNVIRVKERKMRTNKREEIERIKVELNTAKDRLIRAMYELEDMGAIREAHSLETIIEKLEIWQNK